VTAPRRPARARLGLAGYVTILATLRDQPDTSVGLMDRTGIGKTNACLLLPQFHAKGLIHIAGWQYGLGQYTKPVYAYGPGVDAPLPADAVHENGQPRSPRMAKFRGYKPEFIAFACVMDELAMPVTAVEILAATGLARGTLNGVLRALRKHNLARIAGWVKRDGSGAGGRMAQWQLGSAKNAPYPKLDRTVSRRRNRAVQVKRSSMLRVIHAIAGVAAPMREAA
jgi:hypothetical protein